MQSRLPRSARAQYAEDEALIRGVVRRVQRRARGFGHRLPPDEVESLVLESLAKNWRVELQHTGRAQFLTVCAWYAVLDHAKSLQRRWDREETFDPEAERDLTAAGSAPSPEIETLRRENARMVRRALKGLGPRAGLVLTLYHLDGWSHAEIAAHLGIQEISARTNALKARRRLAVLLRELGF